MSIISQKNVLITGISGFVGSQMAKRLIDLGVDVYGLVRQRADGTIPQNIKRLGIESKINLLFGDLENITSVSDALTASDPDIIFHLGGQSYIPRSFTNPIETMNSNCLGTSNLLEAVRIKDLDPVLIFAGSSEEYGLVISSEIQYMRALEKYGTIFPNPEKIPELPINEKNPLRPMSPYAVSKIYGDFLIRNYWHSYGLKTIVSRGFNHEGAGRGNMYVTSVITSQVSRLKLNERNGLTIGNVNAFRDWSHVSDIINGYLLLTDRGHYGDVYNQGSMRTNSVMSYLLLSLEEAGYSVNRIENFEGDKVVSDPTEHENSKIFGIRFEKTKIDDLMLRGKIEFFPEEGGIIVSTDSQKIKVEFDAERFRPAEVPMILSDTKKIKELGFKINYSLKDIIDEQLDHYNSGMRDTAIEPESQRRS